MGWSIGYDNNWKRYIGYGVPAFCDFPTCKKTIDRGLSYVCGGEPYGGERGCGLFFCSKHSTYHTYRDGETYRVCKRCDKGRTAYKEISPEHPQWIEHVLEDKSWKEWREENKEKVAEFRKELYG